MLFFYLWSSFSGLLAFFFTLRIRRHYATAHPLKAVVPGGNEFHYPKVSLIVPACDEVSTLRPSIESLLKLDYPNFEIVLIDDRSTDGTTELVRELSRLDPRVIPVEIKELPAGWLGKLHAMHRGQERASGEWLLFTDADVIHAPQSLKKALTHVAKENLDFLCVLPGIRAKTLPLNVMIAQLDINIAISANMPSLPDLNTSDCMGNGAFNLISRAAFDKTPGFEWLKLEIMDDFALAYMAKLAKTRPGYLAGLGEVERDWYDDVPGFVRGLEKNGFASMQFSLGAVISFLGINWIFVLGATLAPYFTGNLAFAAVIWALYGIHLAVAALSVRRLVSINPILGFFFPVSTMALPFVFLRSALCNLRDGGVRWRGTLYPLAELKAGQRLRILDVVVKRAR